MGRSTRRSVQLADRYSIDQLVAMAEKIRIDPKNRNPNRDSIWIYTKSANKRLDGISWAITYKLQEQKQCAK